MLVNNINKENINDLFIDVNSLGDHLPPPPTPLHITYSTKL